MSNPKSETHIEESDGSYKFLKPVTKEEIIQIALTLQLENIKEMPLLNGSTDSQDFLKLHLSDREQEVFTVLFLNNRHILISCVDMFFGTINGASVYPREIVKEALKQNAASIIVAHNHPSGIPEPSHADIQLTKTIYQALDTVDIKLLDHIIVGCGKTASLAERGLVP
ncbi:MAG: RadC family protein [Arenicella sp.]